MATDDLVLLLVCCLLEVGCGSGDRRRPVFVSDLAFVKAFHFCEDSASAVYFALSTLEVNERREFFFFVGCPPFPIDVFFCFWWLRV